MLKYITKKRRLNPEKNQVARMIIENIVNLGMRAKVYTVLENGDMTYLGRVPLRGSGGLFRMRIPMRMAVLSTTGKMVVSVGSWGRLVYKNALIRVEFCGIVRTAAIDEIIAIEGKI